MSNSNQSLHLIKYLFLLLWKMRMLNCLASSVGTIKHNCALYRNQMCNRCASLKIEWTTNEWLKKRRRNLWSIFFPFLLLLLLISIVLHVLNGLLPPSSSSSSLPPHSVHIIRHEYSIALLLIHLHNARMIVGVYTVQFKSQLNSIAMLFLFVNNGTDCVIHTRFATLFLYSAVTKWKCRIFSLSLSLS